MDYHDQFLHKVGILNNFVHFWHYGPVTSIAPIDKSFRLKQCSTDNRRVSSRAPHASTYGDITLNCYDNEIRFNIPNIFKNLLNQFYFFTFILNFTLITLINVIVKDGITLFRDDCKVDFVFIWENLKFSGHVLVYCHHESWFAVDN